MDDRFRSDLPARTQWNLQLPPPAAPELQKPVAFVSNLVLLLSLAACLLMTVLCSGFLVSQWTRNFWDLPFFLTTLVSWGLLAVVFLGVLRWMRWVNITPTGFVLLGWMQKKVFLDTQVVGIRRDPGLDHLNAFRVLVDVLVRGRVQTIECEYGRAWAGNNPLLSLWQRLEGVLLDRVFSAPLSAATSIKGEGWELTPRGILFAGPTGLEVIQFAAIEKWWNFAGTIRLWRKGEEEPFLKVPAKSRNAAVLIAALERIVTWSPPPLPERPLGRLLVRRQAKDRAVMVVLGVALLGLLAIMAEGWRFINEPLEYEGYFYLGILAAALYLGLLQLWVYRWERSLLVYEHGVAQLTKAGRCEILFSEIESLRCQGNVGRYIILTPQADTGKKTIRYWYIIEVNIERFCLPLVQEIARRWAEKLGQGSLCWTRELRFLPGVLEYRRRNRFRRETLIHLPYDRVDWVVRACQCIFLEGKKTRFRVRIDPPNFFAGLALLKMIVEGDVPGMGSVSQVARTTGS